MCFCGDCNYEDLSIFVVLITIYYFNYDKIFVYFYSMGLMVYFNGSYLVSKYIDNYSVDKLEDFNYINRIWWYNV